MWMKEINSSKPSKIPALLRTVLQVAFHALKAFWYENKCRAFRLYTHHGGLI